MSYDDHRCPNEITHTWKYGSKNALLDAGNGLEVECVTEAGEIIITDILGYSDTLWTR